MLEGQNFFDDLISNQILTIKRPVTYPWFSYNWLSVLKIIGYLLVYNKFLAISLHSLFFNEISN